MNRIFLGTLLVLSIVISGKARTEEIPLVRIEFSMDDRDPMQFAHIVEQYALFTSGQAIDVTHVYNRGHMASRRRQLDVKAMDKVTDLLNALPTTREPKNIPKDLLVTVFVRNDTGRPKALHYRRDVLPTEFKKLIDLLGGPRHGLEGKMKYRVPKAKETK